MSEGYKSFDRKRTLFDKLEKSCDNQPILENIYVTTVRNGFKPDGKGGFSPIGTFTFSDVKFNNGKEYKITAVQFRSKYK